MGSYTIDTNSIQETIQVVRVAPTCQPYVLSWPPDVTTNGVVGALYLCHMLAYANY